MDKDMMMKLLMQMMQQSQQQMAMMLKLMENPDESAPIEIKNDNANLKELQAQLDAANKEIERLKEQLAAAQKSLQISQEKEQKAQEELAELKSNISTIEAYTGESFQEQLETAMNTTGQEYYEIHKDEWYREGYTRREMHDAVADFVDGKSLTSMDKPQTKSQTIARKKTTDQTKAPSDDYFDV